MYWFRSKKLDHFVLFEKIFQTIKSILIIEVQRLKLNITIQMPRVTIPLLEKFFLIWFLGSVNILLW